MLKKTLSMMVTELAILIFAPYCVGYGSYRLAGKMFSDLTPMVIDFLIQGLVIICVLTVAVLIVIAFVSLIKFLLRKITGEDELAERQKNHVHPVVQQRMDEHDRWIKLERKNE